MKLKHFFTALIAVTGLLLCATNASAAEQVKVTKPQFNVAVNGNYVDNDYRQYPFIVYKDVTYFPMTYNDCAFLGLTNSWSPETGTVLSLAPSSGVYDDTIKSVSNKDVTYDGKHLFYATITEGPIWVNNTYVNNSTQQYPILTFRDVPYFPLTWDWCQAFGWTISFTQKGGLSVCSPEYTDKLGYITYYSADGYEYPCILAGIDSLDIGEWGASNNIYSYSPNHFLSAPKKNTSEYVKMYNFCGADTMGYLNKLFVKSSSVPKYEQLGWCTLENPTEMFNRYLSESRSITFSIETAAYFSSDEPEIMEKYIDYATTNYVSVWSYDCSKSMCIPKSMLQIYRDSNWYTYDDMIILNAEILASQGRYAEATMLCSLANRSIDINNKKLYLSAKYTLPYAYPQFEHDDSYNTTLTSLCRKYSDMHLNTSDTYIIPTHSVIDFVVYGRWDVILTNTSYSNVSNVEIYYTYTDGYGNYLHSTSGNTTWVSKFSNVNMYPATAKVFNLGEPAIQESYDYVDFEEYHVDIYKIKVTYFNGTTQTFTY